MIIIDRLSNYWKIEKNNEKTKLKFDTLERLFHQKFMLVICTNEIKLDTVEKILNN